MTAMIQNDAAAIPQKLTEAQIEAGCPDRLKQIGREIEVRLKKADKQANLAQDQLITVEKLLSEAKELCDDGGFKRFRELFCPHLGKSQAYELLAIAAGKKTLIEHRADARERQRRSRAQRAVDSDSVTVTENSGNGDEGADQESRDPALDLGRAGVVLIETHQNDPRLPVAHRHGVSPTDEAMRRFNTVVCELIKVTNGKASDRFIATPVATSDIDRLWKYLRDLSEHMQNRSARARDKRGESEAAASLPAQDAQAAA
jgi:hypothetical protein